MSGININYTFNIITIITVVIAWSVIAFFTYRIYKKQMVKPKIWKILIVIMVGLFSFSINWKMFNALIEFAVLPLGVWILYLFLRRKNGRWQVYRPYAWLGFFANYLFLASTLLALPIHEVIYPKDDPTTYIANLNDASLITIHPSGKDGSIDKETLLNQLPPLEPEDVDSIQWYEDTVVDIDSNEINERFPYQLIGTSPKWGSGLLSMIYIEADGKGILLSTTNEQLYFRAENSVIEGVE